MRRRFLFGLVTLLSVVLVVSFVFASGIVDVSRFLGAPAPSGEVEPASPGPEATVAVDPVEIIDESLRFYDSVVEVNVTVADVSDLFTWQVNMSWNTAVLNVSRVVAGDVLGATRDTSSEVLGLVINGTNYGGGFSAFAESVLGDVSGVDVGVTPQVLATVEFRVVGYGCSNLTLDTLSTVLLNSTGDQIAPLTFTDGWFNNKLFGDADGLLGIDGKYRVSVADIGELSDRWTPTGVKPYLRDADVSDLVDDLRIISVGDIGYVSDNWGNEWLPDYPS